MSVDCFVVLQSGDTNLPFISNRDAGLPYDLKSPDAVLLNARKYFSRIGARQTWIKCMTQNMLMCVLALICHC